MKKYPASVAVIGVILLLAGLALRLTNGPPAADPISVAQCEDRVRSQGAAMIARCQDRAFASAMTATDANEAAAAISRANNAEVGGGMLAMFLIGIGAVMAVLGGIAARQQRRMAR
ncbi:hypothetical protein [Sphingomonas sp. S2-65]|uniref:hypothetical protein n=1 Tax=Sphingomonas sp. S2-65 TaxID=2903960 RepID=UPI001F3C4B25|nr:hypothetical protein [Sphingomonas sp. S2-65]UYY58425.1 hypothetical protein LZ586_17505 [Sphingomonas sp. S2-65]